MDKDARKPGQTFARDRESDIKVKKDAKDGKRRQELTDNKPREAGSGINHGNMPRKSTGPSAAEAKFGKNFIGTKRSREGKRDGQRGVRKDAEGNRVSKVDSMKGEKKDERVGAGRFNRNFAYNKDEKADGGNNKGHEEKGKPKERSKSARPGKGGKMDSK